MTRIGLPQSGNSRLPLVLLAVLLPSAVTLVWLGWKLLDQDRALAGKLTDPGAGRGNFKTPTLREVARTAPYMHDGSLATLEDVVEFHDRGGRRNPQLDPAVRALHLTAVEKTALIAFLQSLSGRISEGSVR